MTLTLTNREKKWGWLYLLLQMLLVPSLCGSIADPVTANVLAYYLNGALALVFFRELLKSSFRSIRWGRLLRTAAAGFGLYWLLSLLTQAVILLLDPDFANINDSAINAMLGESPLLMSLAVVLLAPLAEECLFRGWIFTGLAERSLPLAYGVTAVFFSAAHILGYVGYYDAQTLFLCFLQYLGPGIALCWSCQKARSLAAPLLLHIVINTIALFTLR